ncbi:adenine phosphoribosyltransferase [Rhodanobacter sp. K2T2]|uniref:adenine phosphoribosyltransferase n=1 Tax=Rhodanobacter sp. K2T2 TaxID=2723085 RepID=UPI0015CE3464|nr:adenine phosphoribosyltransferase [Rhodanobacter sp. K2T2]NYE28371.1 adenine phosphoribosyltransferase [Rhodanobacter sp. K2T2]
MNDIAPLIRAVPDFPVAGVTFRDITPLLANSRAFAQCLDALAEPWEDQRVHVVCGIEARGFIVGVALAQKLGVGFVPLRKPGKLPPPVVTVDYRLEYGSDRLEASTGLLLPRQRALIVDDVLATGGTLAAAHALVGRLGGEVTGASVLIELDALDGRSRWPHDSPLHSLVHY